MNEPILRTTNICQIGLVVRDIDGAVERYSALFGVPKPEIILTDEMDKARTTFRGALSPARAKLAFFDLGKIVLELIEPVGGPSTWQESLDTKGEAVHHIAFQVEDTGRAVQSFAGIGVGIAQQGYYTGGMYTYVESEAEFGVVFELLQDF